MRMCWRCYFLVSSVVLVVKATKGYSLGLGVLFFTFFVRVLNVIDIFLNGIYDSIWRLHWLLLEFD